MPPATDNALPATRVPSLATQVPSLATKGLSPATRVASPATKFPSLATEFPSPATNVGLPATKLPLLAQDRLKQIGRGQMNMASGKKRTRGAKSFGAAEGNRLRARRSAETILSLLRRSQ
jgi:hypothetical protein